MLDAAHAEGLRVVLTMLSLPGARWKQNNGDKNDFRLYSDPAFLAAAARFWGDLATALRGHPALAAYNPLNEPRPERAARPVADVNSIYLPVVKAIRAADPLVPIILDGSDDASPAGLARLVPFADDNVLYAFHFYEPWDYINHRAKDPSAFPPHDRAALSRWMEPVRAWQREHRLAPTRIVLEEFGVPRTKPGAAQYLADVVSLAEAEGWHWLFYSFREDTWDQMDYELGSRPLPGAYWVAKERGEEPVVSRTDTPEWAPLRDGLRRRR